MQQLKEIQHAAAWVGPRLPAGQAVAALEGGPRAACCAICVLWLLGGRNLSEGILRSVGEGVLGSLVPPGGVVGGLRLRVGRPRSGHARHAAPPALDGLRFRQRFGTQGFFVTS